MKKLCESVDSFGIPLVEADSKASGAVRAIDRVKKLGIKMSHQKKRNDLIVLAKKDGEVIGTLDVDPTFSRMRPNHVEVKPEWRRKGIATAMYVYAEKITGNRFAYPEDDPDFNDPETGVAASADAVALWGQPNRPFGEEITEDLKTFMVLDEGWKEVLTGVLMAAGIAASSSAEAGQKTFQKAIQGLEALSDRSVKIHVVKNRDGQFDIKVGDYHVSGFAIGGRDGAFQKVKVSGPDNGTGYEHAKALAQTIEKGASKALAKAESLDEDFKTSAKRFMDQGAEQAEVDTAIADFKSLKPRIQDPVKKDIDRWSSWEEFSAFIDELKGTKSKSQLKKAGQEHIGQEVPGAELVAEDPYWWVYKITTHEAARKIGSKTKWCIVANETHWDNYTSDGSHFFFYISKRLKPSVKWYKIAAQVQDGEITYWDSEDNSHQQGSRSIPFKIPAIPQAEIEKTKAEDNLITVYLDRDISEADLVKFEAEVLRFIQVELQMGENAAEISTGGDFVNIQFKRKPVFRHPPEVRSFIRETLKDLGYSVDTIEGLD